MVSESIFDAYAISSGTFTEKNTLTSFFFVTFGTKIYPIVFLRENKKEMYKIGEKSCQSGDNSN